MFRKLVSNLPFSPALVGQLGFYARRLRKEETTRRAGLVLTVLALVVQSFAVFVPSTSANSSSPSDLISGGVTSKAQLLAAYDNPHSDFAKILTYAGVTREELAAGTQTSVNSRDYGTGDGAWLSWGRRPHFSAAQGETKHVIDEVTTVYSRPLWRLDTTEWTKVHGSTYTALVGTSVKMGKFAILYMCGNLVLRKNPEPKVIPDPVYITVCRPGVGIITILESEKRPTDLPPDSEECKPKVPVASCSKLTIMKLDRTQYSFRATASVNHATISSYIFTVRKGGPAGPIAATKTVASSATIADSGLITLKDVATYHISVTVKTSIGEKTSSDCTGTLTVPPLDKCETNPDLFKNDPECKPCPGNPLLWYKSPECREVIASSKQAINLTQDSVDASTLTAVAGDRIEYRLTVSNPGKVPATAMFDEELRDVLEYATIQDNGGGTLNAEKKVLSWPSVQLAPGEKQTRTFVVAVMNTIPTTSRGQSDPTSYDCRMDNTFGDNVQIKVQCDAPKMVESAVTELPKTGPRENVLFAVALLAVVSYFWARSKQLGKEVRLIRKDFSATGAF